MIYDPNKLPFWEIARGDGPYTRLKWHRKKWRYLNRGKHDFTSLSNSDTMVRTICCTDKIHRQIQYEKKA